MGYLATSNTNPPASQAPVKPLQFHYVQSATSASFNGYQNSSKAGWTFSSTAGVNSTDSLFTSAASVTNSSSNNTIAGIQFPSSGVWTVVWGTRFSASTSENDTWLHVISSKTYGETGTTGAANVRLGVTSTTAFNTTVSWTGYAAAGDVFGLAVYSAASNTTLGGASYGANLTANLVLPA